MLPTLRVGSLRRGAAPGRPHRAAGALHQVRPHIHGRQPRRPQGRAEAPRARRRHPGRGCCITPGGCQIGVPWTIIPASGCRQLNRILTHNDNVLRSAHFRVVSDWLHGPSYYTGCLRLNGVLTHNNNVRKSAASPTRWWGCTRCSWRRTRARTSPSPPATTRCPTACQRRTSARPWWGAVQSLIQFTHPELESAWFQHW